MEIEAQPQHRRRGSSSSVVSKDNDDDLLQMSKGLRRALVVLNYTMMVLGSSASPLLLRLYFLRGGSRKWLSSWLQAVGFPLILIPLSISYFNRRRHNRTSVLALGGKAPTITPFFMTTRVFIACTVLGILTGIDNFLYSFGMSYLPYSTSAILVSTQLGFTAFFAYLLVKQRFTPFSINAIALLSFGAVILGMGAGKDRPKGESGSQYSSGFVMTLGAALLYGAVLPLVELTYAKARQAVTYTLVMEMQLVMGFFATAVGTVGMIVNKDFQAITREARAFELGETKYYMVLICSAVLWQCFFLGIVGVIFYSSALLAGVINAVLIPVAEVLAVIFFHEPFSGGKGISLALSLWGFASYFYGEYKENKNNMVDAEPGLLESEN